jgi:hypothetical protein
VRERQLVSARHADPRRSAASGSSTTTTRSDNTATTGVVPDRAAGA